MDWSERMAGPDALIDEELGDEFEMAAAPGGAYTTVKGYVYPPGTEAEIAFAPIDPIIGKPRIKIARRLLAKPTNNHRFKVPQLADPAVTHYKPSNWTPVDSGRYWLIDIQKAVT